MISKQQLLSLHTNQRLFVIEMQKRGIDVNIEQSNIELLHAQFKEHVEWILDRDSSIMPYSNSILCGNKYLTKKILERENIQVPKGEKFTFLQQDIACLFADKIGYPIVLKPVFGSHGDNVFVDIESEKELQYYLAKMYDKIGSEEYIIEKQFIGNEYRIFITKEKKYAVLHRDPAHVIGDGTHSISELIFIENEKRKKRINSLCPIKIDFVMHNYLAKQNLRDTYKPHKNEKIYLRNNSNIACGGNCIDVTNIIHSEILDICHRVLYILGVPYLGIDYMTQDISERPLNYNIIEVNTVPGIHMHMKPSSGNEQNIASYIVDMIFPETKNKEGQA